MVNCSQFCSQQLKSTILVPELSPFFSAKDANSCWFVDKIDSCLHLVDILACMMITQKKWPNEDFSFLFFFLQKMKHGKENHYMNIYFFNFADSYLLHPQTSLLLVQYLLGRSPPQHHPPKSRISISSKDI